MSKTDLLDILSVKQTDDSVFESEASAVNYAKIVFGGQALAQSLLSAYQTVDSRPAHSLHAYFLRAGSAETPISYEVENLRDGRSLSSRLVNATQTGKSIFQMMASFHEPEPGYEYQNKPNDDIARELEIVRSLKAEDISRSSRFRLEDLISTSNVDFLYLNDSPYTDESTQESHSSYWFRVSAELPSDIALHHAAIAFVCDLGLTATAIRPHPISLFSEGLQVASLDHAIWFHSDSFNANEWMCYQIETTRSGKGRGFSRGQIYSEHGQHIATISQETLVRINKL